MKFLDKILKHIQDVQEGRAKLSDKAYEYYIQKRSEDAKIKFCKEKEPFRIRPSRLGVPLYIQQLEKLGIPKDEDEPYQMSFRFATGNDFEALFFAYAISAGVLEAENIGVKVALDIDGTKCEGTIDCIIDDKVFDVKTYFSPNVKYSKWAKAKEDFNLLLQDDPFGYVMQLMLYSYYSGRKPGGWLLCEKGTHEISSLPFIENYTALQDAYLGMAVSRVKALNDTYTIEDVIEIPYTIKEEKKGNKATGRRILVTDGALKYFPYKKGVFGAYKENNTWYVD